MLKVYCRWTIEFMYASFELEPQMKIYKSNQANDFF